MPIRPLAAEDLKAMASRQQQQIESQHQLLTQKEQRLRFLKAQENRGPGVSLDNEKLRRLKERVEAQESKLRRLRALKGQIDVQKTYNVALSNDLDSIRACFSEKEKELSIAVAKVEALTRQLEELRRGRRGFGLSPQQDGNNQQTHHSSVTRELEKLRRELMYRNQLSLQQDARLHLQREALQQRQAELRSVDQRIIELQERLQKRKSANILQQTNLNVNNNNHNNNNMAVKGSSMHVRSASTHVYPVQKNTKCNIVAVEPYNHTPNSSVVPVNPKHSIIDDLALLKLSQDNSALHSLIDSEKNELNRHLLIKQVKDATNEKFSLMKQDEITATIDDRRNINSQHTNINNNNNITNNNNNNSNVGQSGRKSTTTNDENLFNNDNNNDTSNMLQSHHIISSIISSNAAAKHNNEMESNNNINTTSSNERNIISSADNNNESYNEMSGLETLKKIHSIHHNIPSGNLVVPPRKPISKVAPNVNTQLASSTNENDKNKPALPPKPLKTNKLTTLSNDDSNSTQQQLSNLPIKAKPLTIKKQPLSEQPRLRNTSAPLLKPIQAIPNRKVEPNSTLPSSTTSFNASDVLNNDDNISHIVAINKKPTYTIDDDYNGNSDNFIINKLINSSNIHNLELTTTAQHQHDEPDKVHIESTTTLHQENEKPFGINNIVRRTRNLIGDSTKTKLARRVSFDPLALLLDASLEGELELVKKTAMQVPNPSASNDEGITALHNAICAGHLEIVKFLVQFGCDVNAQDSDGWTPLHCAASCNNLAMVKFLVDSGACLFASTLSDHETPAEKCEEDEEGFDGCSEYLYSIQEKLGILHNGEVYAVFSYNAQQPDELEFEVNDKVIILRKGDEAEREWWWAKNEANREGYVPRNLLGLYPRIIPSSNQIVGE